MKIGIDSTTNMKSDLQTNVIPFIVDIETIVKEP
jgi:hypothetical protein